MRPLHVQRWQRISIVLGLLLAVAMTSLAESDTAPNWVQEIANRPPSFSYGKAPAAVLLEEDFIDVSPDGTFTYRTRGITRIITADGRSEAKAVVGYNTEMARIVSFRAWLIRPKGPILVFGKDKIVENAASGTGRDLYSASRIQQISAVEDAEEGSVFAWERVREEKQIISQAVWGFAARFPVECSRLSIRLPKDWEAEPHFFNHAPIPAINAEHTFTWELSQIHAMRREPFAPDPVTTQPYMGVDIKPPVTAKDICRRPLFSWPAISAFFSPLYDKAATSTPAMQAKANELVSGATTLAERISRLCLFAQQTNYISIRLNSAEGGGMIPQPAEKVFRCNYGDCKDKATFLRALLRTQGIDSIPVIVFSGDAKHVHPEWAATMQFNHVILAIKVDDTVDGTALLVHPKHGRLIIFDPTNPYVPFRILSRSDSGGHGLLVAGSEGELIQLPAIQPSIVKKTIAYQLHPDGSLTGTIERRVTGQTAFQVRGEFRNASPTEFQNNQLKQLKQSLPVSEINQLAANDAFAEGAFALKYNFTAQNHGKAMRNTLLVFKPAILPLATNLPLSRIKRTQPIQISAVEVSETTEITLPGDTAIDELPADSNLSTSFGSYTAVLKKTDNGQLTLTRTLILKETTTPAEQYQEIVRFAEKIQEAEQSPVVLKHQ